MGQEVFEVIHPGALTSVQDLGRYGYQRYGVPISGAMDKFALRVANLLAGNEEGEAALEATIIGPKLRALGESTIALAGGDLSPRINGRPCAMWCAHLIKEGDLISFGPPRSGCRTYLAVSGGIDVPPALGSCSTHLRLGLGGFGRALAAGDLIQVRRDSREPANGRLPEKYIPHYGAEWLIRVILGPQMDYFTMRGISQFLGGEYVITPQSDRMGFRLKGPRIEHRAGADILTDATPPGSVQVPGDGMPIILVADGQATGGYSKIGVVISPDQDKLGQAKPGEKIRFEKVTLSQAHRAMKEMRNQIQEIKGSLVKSALS